jgi:methyltransferase (TIGR00027 family)
MKPGHASRTAELVCMGRALAHLAPTLTSFHDPTAFALLPEEARARVERARRDEVPRGVLPRIERAYLRRQSKVMVARTLTIDEAVRSAHAPQVVILGAGLDGRAWRMPELADVVVFEVDHPDSQRDKRARIASLPQTAEHVHFVAVDFERDDLESALAKAGHDSTRPTTWIWEGVVMYLTRADVEASLAVIERRSAPHSRLIVAYHSPALITKLVGLVVNRLGEPLRSAFTPEAMAKLLEKYGFSVLRDDDIRTIGAALDAEIARATKVIKHLRIVTADFLRASRSVSKPPEH